MATDPLRLLQRTDKWYLGSGDGLIWAPPFPAWHDTPGFWDEAHLLQYPVAPLFALMVDPGGGEFPLLRARSWRWSPESLTLEYRIRPGLRARETRTAPGDRTLRSDWKIENRTGKPAVLDFFLWTALPGEAVADDGVMATRGGIAVVRSVRDRKDHELQLKLNYRLGPGPVTRAAYRSEASGTVPDFRLTPFFDRWDGEKLPGEIRLEGISRRGLVYLALHRKVRIPARRSAQVSAAVQVTPVDLPVPRRSGRSWTSLAAEVPELECSDRLFTRYWWYRWYGLRLNGVPAGLGQYRHPTVCEGIGYFHQPISYSAMCHARELRWLRTPEWAEGVIRTFAGQVREDGSMPGRMYLDHLTQPDFYHADWGGAVRDHLAVHPRSTLARDIYPALERYARWLRATRDAGGTGMIDVVDQFETGQEYMSRYEAVDPEADRYGWENRIRLKGIDVTFYAWRLYRVLADYAPDPTRRSSWSKEAERTRDAVRTRMWDPDAAMFSDVDPRTGDRTGVSAAVCFYPFLDTLADGSHLEAIGRHLLNPSEFWTTYPAPSSSVTDPRFNPDAEWKGKRHVCPWNGRVWPMTNSHLVDALARVVREHRRDWALQAVHFLRQFLRMMSFDGGGRRPNCFEHYHPWSGRGSVYRGIDDYQHSWVNDLIVRHVAGLIPRGEEGVTVDPLPFGVSLSLKTTVFGKRLALRVTPREFELRIGRTVAGRGRTGTPLEVAW